MLNVIGLLLQPLLHPRLQGKLAKFSSGSDDVFLVNRCAAHGRSCDSSRVAIRRHRSVTPSPSPQPLGVVMRVRLWHNNVGKHPDWHVKCVEVSEFSNPLADVRVFDFNQWLSMDKDNCRFDASVQITSLSALWRRCNVLFGWYTRDAPAAFSARWQSHTFAKRCRPTKTSLRLLPLSRLSSKRPRLPATT